MRFCVSCRQPLAVRKQADELKVEWKDKAFIDNYLDNKGNHTIILEIPKDAEIDWDYLSMWHEKLDGKLILCLESLWHSTPKEAINRGIEFYWKYPVSSKYELNAVKRLGVCQVIVGIPLIFDIKSIKFPIRLIPNATMMDYLPNDDLAAAGWIRPESLALYEEYAESCEFFHNDLPQEATLMNIYKRGSWKDDLTFLFVGQVSGKHIYNQYLPESFGKMRMSCKHRCQENLCSTCYSSIRLAEMKQGIRKLIEERKDEENGNQGQ